MSAIGISAVPHDWWVWHMCVAPARTSVPWQCLTHFTHSPIIKFIISWYIEHSQLQIEQCRMYECFYRSNHWALVNPQLQSPHIFNCIVVLLCCSLIYLADHTQLSIWTLLVNCGFSWLSNWQLMLGILGIILYWILYIFILLWNRFGSNNGTLYNCLSKLSLFL